MIYYKDADNKLYAFEDNVTQDIIDMVANKHNTTLTQITKEEYDELRKPTLEQLKQYKKSEIETVYNQKLQEPIIYNYNTFQADFKSQDILTKVITSAASDFETDWLDIDNNLVHMTLDDLKGLANSILARGQELFRKKIELKLKIEHATTVDELNQIDIIGAFNK